MTDDYTPIDCDVYERFELAVMHRESLFIRWRDSDGVTHMEWLQPFDLRARAGEEFLHSRTPAGDERVLRLDCITGIRSRT